MKEPEVSVGIVSGNEIRFALNNKYLAKGEIISGEQSVSFSEGGILWNNNLYRELTFVPQEKKASFSLYDVTIGINFHWERKETQIFSGTLKLVVHEGKICAINILPVEDYLISVISSEMKATSALEFLKAHAVISRSWLLAQIEKRNQNEKKKEDGGFFSFAKTETEYIKWYDREDHTIFDVCADDHCQRYQGVGRITPAAREAVRQTRGLALVYGDEICDARFSKCCGGRTEVFASCWEDRDVPYLQAVDDADERGTFCQRATPELLQRSMNNYDLMTRDFFSWSVSYEADELSEIVEQKGHLGLGRILSLEPLERGESGRIVRLRIVGEKRTVDVGKELEIRRMLSHSHLYSSAFDVEKTPQGFTLSGRGWGHGVGLCQIGAAVMADEGYTFEQILTHYYINASVKRIY